MRRGPRPLHLTVLTPACHAAPLSAARFFAIRWPLFPAEALPGATYVLPTLRGVVRAFVPADEAALERYAGRLLMGRLCYCGPLASGVELRHLLAKAA